MDKVSLRVPATSANLACGFDTLGCALGLYNNFDFVLSDRLGFSGCDAKYHSKENLAYRGFAAVYEALGIEPPPVHISIDANIPISRGLGSSAAMIAAGAVAANYLSEAELTKQQLLAVCNPIEGHPDNLAPAIFGGLIASSVCGDRVCSASYKINPALRFSVLSPDYTLDTHSARAALPKEVSYADAIYDLPRLAMLPRAFENGDMELLSFCLDDLLHQPYRRPLIPGYEDIRERAAKLGCRCVCISGSGPSILCVSDDESFGGKMREAVSDLTQGWTLRELSPDEDGAAVIDGF